MIGTPVALGRPAQRPRSVVAPELDPAERARRAELRVALVSMPMAAIDRPSLALGLLAEIGRAHGFTVDTVHAHLELAAMAGPVTARTLFREAQYQLCEWLFAKAAFGEESATTPAAVMAAIGDHVEHVAAMLSRDLDRAVTPAQLLGMRDDLIPKYLARVGEMVDWARYDVVGFTSTFQQNVASIAMARRLKRDHPHLRIIGGGANFEGEMGFELLRATPWYDFAVSGEADAAFPALLAAISDDHDPSPIPGVLARRGGSVVGVPAPQVHEMDALPVPDFGEFFERGDAIGLTDPADRRRSPLPFETSRGCWWGQKRHCTFCGLNGQGMEHRAKSPDRVVEEIGALTERYGSFDLRATDNIMDERYFDELLPVLIAEESDVELFYEIKANLSRERIEQLARAGVRSIQPGIESLSSDVLRLMDKGIKAATNVNLLRWATHHGIVVSWNVLYGFPGETQQHYDMQADLAEQLIHLPPPQSMTRLWLERFSPMFRDRDRFPVERLAPQRGYELVYPPDYDLDRLAYFFDHEFVDQLPDAAYERLHKVVDDWKLAWEAPCRPTLELWRSPTIIRIEDRRLGPDATDWVFEGDLRAIYLACFDRPRSARQVVASGDGRLALGTVEAALQGFTERGLMMRDGNLFLALALPGRPSPR